MIYLDNLRSSSLCFISNSLDLDILSNPVYYMHRLLSQTVTVVGMSEETVRNIIVMMTDV